MATDRRIYGWKCKFFDEHMSMMERLTDLNDDTRKLADALFDSDKSDVNDLIMIERYLEREMRLLSEINSFLVLENTVRAIFPDLRTTPAEKFLIVQKIISSAVNDFVISADTFKKLVGSWSAKDSRFVNLQKDMTEIADDVVDMFQRKKDRLDEFMSEIGEQLE